MGAALTYARRYALFTLVGIAGVDDLDAPDLLSPAPEMEKTDGPSGNKKDHVNDGLGHSIPQVLGGHHGVKASSTLYRPKLEPEASAALRDQLTAELKTLRSADEAAVWAHRAMGSKNCLNAADAENVERAFQARLAIIAVGVPTQPVEVTVVRPRRPKHRRRDSVVDKSLLALPAPRRIRDREHVKSVAKQPCLVCGRHPTDAHHLRFAQSPALGRKVSDEFTVPLCRGHHREVHRHGDEAGWWIKAGIDPTAAARNLWLRSHPLAGAMDQPGSKLQNEANLESASP